MAQRGSFNHGSQGTHHERGNHESKHEHGRTQSHHCGGHMGPSETTLRQRGMARREPNAVDASTRVRGLSVNSSKQSR
jgi:hypothetical protein